MPLPIITDVFRCAVEQHNSVTNTSAYSIIHIIDGSQTASQIGTHVNAAFHATNFWDNMANTTHLVGTNVTPLDGVGTSVFVPAGSNTAAGSATGDPIPAVCQTVTLYTDKRGRSYRGRIYMPFVAESKLTAGIIDPTGTATAQADATAFMTTLASTTGGIVVASYLLSTSELVTSVLVRGKASTQRRRQSAI